MGLERHWPKAEANKISRQDHISNGLAHFSSGSAQDILPRGIAMSVYPLKADIAQRGIDVR
jgi:hypothetical protein